MTDLINLAQLGGGRGGRPHGPARVPPAERRQRRGEAASRLFIFSIAYLFAIFAAYLIEKALTP